MQTKKSPIAFIVAVCLLISVIAPAALGQQAVIGDWSIVQSLSLDDEIAIMIQSFRGGLLPAYRSPIVGGL